jgi:TPP-dependent pyruvate/acetoin dehydrogenase alpha subunit
MNHETILKQGRYRALSIRGVQPELVRRLHRWMLWFRRCEEALINEYHPADEMRCPVHFCLGQEAVPAALSTIVRPEDYLFSHHRSHGYFLAKGAPLKALFAELYGRETGANGGKAGSQDISMHSVNFYSGAILTGAVAISVGAAMAVKLKGQPRVVVAGFGEGATDEGVFWEAINLASLRKLPVVFICENNRYATYSPLFKRHVADNINEQVESFGVHTNVLFGNDVIAVHKALTEAFEHTRSGRGPVFIEAYTYRWNGHVGPENDDHIGYRPQAELEFWKSNDPIVLLEDKMIEAGLLDAIVRERLVAEIDKELSEAFAFAKNSPFPTEVDWRRLNYSSGSPLADQLLRDVEAAEFDQRQADTIPGPY